MKNLKLEQFLNKSFELDELDNLKNDENIIMYFSVDNPLEFANLTNTKLISVDPFFKRALKDCKKLKLMTKIFMYFADKLNRTMIISLKLN